MRTLFQDVRYGWRMLLKKPGFTIIAAPALALGIGANSAIFSMVNAILLKPLPLNDLDRIVTLWEMVPSRGVEHIELAAPIRGEIQAIDRDQPVFDIKSMAQVRDRSIMPFRVLGMLLSGFGVFALILAATGIYGAMAYAVSQRTREVGVRMALGAERGDILKLLVVGQGMRMTAIGIIIGLAGAIGLAQVLKGILFGVGAIEWATFTGVALLLTGVSLLACYIPARRAAKVDPMVALRYE